MQFLTISFGFADGLAVGATSLVGQSLGRREPKIAHMYGKMAQRCAMLVGLVIGNGLVGLSGALYTQYLGSVAVNMGRGAIVIGLAAIIIGESIFSNIFRNFALKLLSVSFGSIIYYIVIQFVISVLKIDSNYLKLISALIVAIFLTVPNWKGKFTHFIHKSAKAKGGA